MMLGDYAQIVQGTNLSRVKSENADDMELFVYTMKEMNDMLENFDSSEINDRQVIRIAKSKYKEDMTLAEGDLVVNLLSKQAAVMRTKYLGSLPSSNFAIIKPSEQLDSLFFEWYFNEHPDCRAQLQLATQGSRVAALSIQKLRTLNIQLPSLQKQRDLGKLHNLFFEKRILLKERMTLEEKYINYKIFESVREVGDDEN